MPEYVIIEQPDGARYAVPEGGTHLYPAAKVVGREGVTGVPQAPEAERAPEAAPPSQNAPAPTARRTPGAATAP